MRTSRLQRVCPALAHLTPLVGAEDQGKAAALLYHASVGRCCRNAQISCKTSGVMFRIPDPPGAPTSLRSPADDHGKAAALPYHALVRRCCRNALIVFLLLLAVAPLRAQPVITAPPQSKTVRVGETAFFTVAATGTPPLTYRWRKDGEDILGTTGATCALGLARPDQSGDYTVVVSDASGSVISASPAELTVQPRSPGAVVAWGHNGLGETTVPVAAQGGVAAIAAGGNHTVALKNDGLVIAWGFNNSGQTIVPAAAQSGVTAIAVGQAHTVALKIDGSVIAWGWNFSGQTSVPATAQSGVTAIAAGGVHTVALKDDGSVVAWGNNNYGQTTVPVAAQSGVTAIAAGANHTVALKSDGRVVAWGGNTLGQTTVPVAAQSGVVSIAAGADHTVALKSDGSVMAWGFNLSGQTTVPIAAQSGVVSIAAGSNAGHTLALKSDGSVVAWGNNYDGQATVPVAAQSGVTAIAAGAAHSAALFTLVAPTIVLQPLNQVVDAGQPATFTITASGFYLNYQWRKDGAEIVGATDAAYFLPSVQSHDAGNYTVVVSNASGSVTSDVATLTVRVFAPTIITQPASQTAVIGDTITFFVEASGAPPPTYQWQFNGVPIPDATNAVLRLDNLARAQAGSYCVVISNSEGSSTSQVATLTVHYVIQFSAARSSVWETGRVAVIRVRRGDDGSGTVTVNYATSDGTATAGQDYTATSGTLTFGPGEAEKSFTIPILDDAFPEGAETLRLILSGLTGPAVFGANTNAQVTIIDDEQSSAPGTRARPVIASGRGHTVAIKVDGSLWAWGDNNFGQLGIESEMQHTNALTRVGADQDWKTVAAGEGHTLAVKRDGSLWAWGSNINGELGVEVEPSVAARAPSRVGTDTDWQMVYAGPYRSLGLRWDGSLWTWGGNCAGSLGLGDDAPGWTNRPTRVGSESDWAWVGGGGPASFAIKHDGSLWAWGHMGYFPAQLGLGDLSTGTNVPMQVGFDNDWERVVSVIYDGQVAVYGPSLAVKSDGSLWSWGHNLFGELGDAAVVTRSSPGRVGDSNDWATVELGISHALALRRDGSLWAWGQNSYGKLGLGVDFGPNQLEPTRVGPDNDWVAVTAGQDYSIGLRSDGSLWSWGYNGNGQLGLGGLSQTNVPTRIGTDNDWALPVSSPVRGEFRIVAQSINVDHSRTLFFTHTNSRAYYVLYRGDSLTNITAPADAALASRYPSLTDRTPPATNATAFYRIRAVPRTQPLDLDHDGIEDYYELRHAAFLHPLNPADAAQDTDGDGYSNLSEYRAGTDPARPTVRHSIASGLAHTVVLKQDGSLWAWGDNTHGQLGDGTYESRAEPVRIGTDTNWVSVSAGRDSQYGDSTVALKRDGSLWAWGANFYGQLGYPPDQVPGTNVPVRVGNSTAWTDVSAGGGYSAALQRNGSLWIWGNNSGGELLPARNDPWNPIRVGTDTDWATLSAGGQHILAIKANGSLWAWGNNDVGQCGVDGGVFIGGTPTRVGTDNDWIAIAASGDTDFFNGTHSLGLKADGTLWSWGYNPGGELGLGNAGFNQVTPARVGTDADWTAIAAGEGTSLARKRDGSLWAWGLGIDAVPSLASERHDWRDFAAGGSSLNFSFTNFANAVATDGSLWTWHFLPLMSRVPVKVGSETNWAAVTAGGEHSLALKLDGSLWSWGGNGSGQLGDGTFTSKIVPNRIDSNTTWRYVSAGVQHSLALREDDTLWSWGDSSFGQLGIGTFTPFGFGLNTPQPVATNATWLSITAGGLHSVAVRADGSLWTWGRGDFGELGNGVFLTNAPYGIASPFAVEPGTTWSAVAAGSGFTFGLRSDGSLWACGNNLSGHLGLGLSSTNVPYGISTLQRVPTNVLWQSLAAGGSHTVALDMDGKLWGWGENYYGHLGNGSFDAAISPQSIAPDKAWKAVAAGGSHTVALGSDGTLWTWGANYFGQLGIGTSDNSRNTPQPVQPNTTWKGIAAGGSHSLGIREDGTLWSWGWNLSGQLGIPPDLTPTRLGTATDWGSPP